MSKFIVDNITEMSLIEKSTGAPIYIFEVPENVTLESDDDIVVYGNLKINSDIFVEGSINETTGIRIKGKYNEI